tara:strand:- start:414 stop:821 length:408 start_codon:yes stop_codon:yes gene_type:complete
MKKLLIISLLIVGCTTEPETNSNECINKIESDEYIIINGNEFQQYISINVYPDPTNGPITIALSVLNDGLVFIYILNENFVLIKTLINEFFSAGTHSFTWDITNEEGSLVPSGSYYVIAELDDLEVCDQLTVLNQ